LGKKLGGCTWGRGKGRHGLRGGYGGRGERTTLDLSHRSSEKTPKNCREGFTSTKKEKNWGRRVSD